MDKSRPGSQIYLLTILAISLSSWLILYGLQMRFFGGFLPSRGVLSYLTPPLNFVRLFGFMVSTTRTGELGWPLVVIGCSLLSSLAGLWIRQRWALPSFMIFSVLSILTLHWMNIISLLLLLMARSQSVRDWFPPKDVTHG